jgi:tetratricopeptide (TPR) repeat protein
MLNTHWNPRQKSLALLLGGALWTAAAAATAAVPQAHSADHKDLQAAQQGLDLLMNGDPEGAVQVFKKIQVEDPGSPLGSLLEANAVWWKIFLTTGNLIDPDVFNARSSSTTPYDSHFSSLVDAAISKARKNISANHDVARNYLYEGMAYALRARFAGMRNQALPAARAGKQMRSLLITALENDKYLRDAYLGLGLYEYFVDTLPTFAKLFRWILGLPGGSRAKGLQEMEYAAKYGELTRGEAKFYLAKDYSRSNERQYAKSLELFQELQREYPDNELWKLQIGSLEIRMGHAQDGEVLYRQVLEETRGKQSEVEQALYRAVKQALERRHPKEKFE